MSVFDTSIFVIQVDLDLVDFVADPSVALKGSSVSRVGLFWDFNKTIDTVDVAGVTLNGNQTSTNVTGPFTDDQTWMIKGHCTTERASGSAKLSFLNYAYWGTGTSLPGDSAAVLALGNHGFISTSTPNHVGYYCPGSARPIFCMPSRLGSPTSVKITQKVLTTPNTVEWISFSNLTTVNFSVTNTSGFTEDYVVMIFNSLPRDTYFEVQWT